MKTIIFYLFMIAQLSAQSEYENVLVSSVEQIDKIGIISNREEVKKETISLKLTIPVLGNISISNPSKQLKEIIKKLELQECSMQINPVESISFTENKKAVLNK
jgi:hypothetical protein